MTTLEKALVAAAKTFVAAMATEGGAQMERGAPPAGVTSISPQVGAPVCPVHGRAMRASNKGNGFYCSAKVGEGYCKERASA